MWFQFFWHSLHVLKHEGWKDTQQNTCNSNFLIHSSDFYFPFSIIFLIFNSNHLVDVCVLKVVGRALQPRKMGSRLALAALGSCLWSQVGLSRGGWRYQLQWPPPILLTPSPREWLQGIEERAVWGLDAVRTPGFFLGSVHIARVTGSRILRLHCPLLGLGQKPCKGPWVAKLFPSC